MRKRRIKLLNNKYIIAYHIKINKRSEEHATSIFRVEVCRLRNRFGYIGKYQGRWKGRGNGAQHPIHFNPEDKGGMCLRNVGIRLRHQFLYNPEDHYMKYQYYLMQEVKFYTENNKYN
jgi:rRNA maturation protein Nop10